jgi:hypothetical protein
MQSEIAELQFPNYRRRARQRMQDQPHGHTTTHLFSGRASLHKRQSAERRKENPQP